MRRMSRRPWSNWRKRWGKRNWRCRIRGMNTSGVISTLLDKHLITTAGRKEVMGRPILYKTSKEFLMRFGLSDLEELPSLKEFEALAREALGSDEGFAPVDEAATNEANIGAS